MIVKTGCGTDGAFYSTTLFLSNYMLSCAPSPPPCSGGRPAGPPPGGHPRAPADSVHLGEGGAGRPLRGLHSGESAARGGHQEEGRTVGQMVSNHWLLMTSD